VAGSVFVGYVEARRDLIHHFKILVDDIFHGDVLVEDVLLDLL